MIKSWMVIGGVTLLLVFALSSLTTTRGAQWFRRLQRPAWLTIEWAIPLIWTTIFICGAWSAVMVWERDPASPQTWWRMALYLLLEVVTLSYTPVMLWLRRLRVGVVIGATGLLLAIFLTIIVWPISGWATLLLLPYLIWSPIGTYTTWAMIRLNPADG
ncbi:MAG TPA: TspO/MBR family protein [Chroococcidiopsis sp.]